MVFLHRFFVKEENIKNDHVKISGKDYKHISKALRLEVGDKIIACTGDGYDLIVELEKFDSDSLLGKIIRKEKNKNEAFNNITIAQAIPKKRNMELVVKKTTEIGVNKIIPLTTKRTIVKLKGKKKKKRISRWQRIAEEAAKQSQRGIIPKIEDIYTVNQLKTIRENYDLIFVLWASEQEQSFTELTNVLNTNNQKDIMLLIGPEGGFNKNEIDFLKDELNAVSLTLGPRILRTETAPIVGLSILLYEIGDLGG